MLKHSSLIISVVAAFAALSFQSCSQPKSDPLKEAIVQGVMAANPDVKSFTVSEVTKVSDVTLEDELGRRTALLETKLKAETRLAEKYANVSMRTNEKRHAEAKDRTAAILEALGSYKEEHTAQLDSIVYSIFEFKGYGTKENGSSVKNVDMVVAVTPDMKTYNIIPAGGSNSNVHKGMGRAIPGYMELLESFHTPESED